MKDKVAKMLLSNKGDFISGEELSKKLGVSRTSIWKYITKLKKEGYEIESISRKGYKLISFPDILTQTIVEDKLNTEYIGRKIIHYDSVESTNNEVKKIAQKEEEGLIIVAEEQTKGKGRLGRNWTSPKQKGLWFSILLKPNISPSDAPKITQIGAAAISKTISDIDIKTEIKWPNDIIINSKKVCGILTEMSGELNKVNYIVIGIGINVNIDKNEIPNDIKEIATSLKIEKNNKIDRRILLANILNNFENLYEELKNNGNINSSIDICRKDSSLIGKKVKVINGGKEKIGLALNINDEGQLLIEYEDGKIENIISGEISIRGLKGYV